MGLRGEHVARLTSWGFVRPFRPYQAFKSFSTHTGSEVSSPPLQVIAVPHGEHTRVQCRSPALRQFLGEQTRNTLPLSHNASTMPPTASFRLALENSYQQWMQQALHDDHPDLAHELFHEFRVISAPQKPTTRMIDQLFISHQRMADVDQLVDDVESLVELADQFTESNFIHLIQAFSNCNEYEKAESVFQWARETLQAEPPVHAYNALMSSAESRQGIKLLQQMRQSKINPNLQTYWNLLQIYEKEEKGLELERLLDEMKRDHVRPTDSFLVLFLETISLIPSYRNKRLVEKMVPIITSVGLVMQQDWYNVVGLYYSMIHSPAKGLEFLALCEKEGRTSEELYWNILQGYIQEQDFVGMYQTLHDVREHLTPERLHHAYNALMDVAVHTQPRKALDLMTEMDELIIATDMEYYDVLLRGLCGDENIKRFDLIGEFWRRAAALDAPIEEETMHLLMHRASEMQSNEFLGAFLNYMYEQDMPITEELMDLYNSPVSGVIDEEAWKLPTVDDGEDILSAHGR